MFTNSPSILIRFSSLSLVICFLFMASARHLNAQQPFPFLQPGLSQQLFATGALPPGEIDGGIAFAPNGDLWVDSCDRGTLFKFQASATTLVNGTLVHPQAPGSPVAVPAACGLTNHPDGTMYSNTSGGIANLNASTGAQIRPTFGPPGNGLGIAIDPQTGNLVYVGGTGGSCFGAPPCAIISLNPATTTSSTFALLSPADATFIDGIFFDPSGNFLFMAVRTPDRGLTVLDRSGGVVQHVSMNAFPDGVAFHTVPDYVVTNNNDGTITRFDFPGGDFTALPAQSFLASGGFRGDLSQVGPDSCLYATQAATRFLDGTLSANNSVVRICPGFVPQPGAVPAHFVIGDGNAAAGSEVTFWGSQWAKDNSLSGGATPRAFKGFADSVPEGCGGTWTTAPGDSSSPPDTVSPFIAVIVSHTIAQSGSNLAGDVSKIVIVRTNPGYGPAPGHPGTGTIVAVVCGN